MCIEEHAFVPVEHYGTPTGWLMCPDCDVDWVWADDEEMA